MTRTKADFKMTPSAIVAIILALSIIVYFIAQSIITYQHVDLITMDRTKIWSEIIMTLVGGLLVYIAKGDK